MRKILCVLLVLSLAATMVFAGGKRDEAPAAAKTEAAVAKIGVSMPTQSLQRWNQDGANMKAQFEKAGFDVDLQYAGDNDIPTQVA